MKAQGAKQFVQQKKKLQTNMAKKIKDAAHVVDKKKIIRTAKKALKHFLKTGEKTAPAPAKHAAPAPAKHAAPAPAHSSSKKKTH